ncbi:MAG: hypothetical protein Athens071416_200 [Parcubacteria group bacterium Athens0714_16]|nr:MAG: hypothetical protein Athens071416_200 [Parcubacteria group bacterium Athens0714_16]
MIKKQTNMIFPSKTKKILIIVSVITILVLSFDVFFMISLGKKTDSVTKLRGDFLVELKKEKQLDLIKKIIKETGAEQSSLDLCFVSSNGVVDFIKTIELVSELVGVTVDTKTVGVENSELIKNVNVETLSVEFVIQGSWTQTLEFLSLIENIQYDTTIERMSINKFTDAETKKESWKSSFTIKAIKI